MFTGLVETIGVVSNISRLDEVIQLEISAPKISGELKLGDSVSVSGACLTVIKNGADRFTVEMMEETARVTKFSSIRTGSRVNLERALRIDSRLDGHLVAGHVDGTAEVMDIEIYGRTRKYIFTAAEELLRGMLPKGSVAIDGVSLTLIEAGGRSFSVGIIPTTISDTTIADLKKGDVVNIETDVIGKYVLKLLDPEFRGKAPEQEMKDSLTWDKLAEYGWI